MSEEKQKDAMQADVQDKQRREQFQKRYESFQRNFDAIIATLPSKEMPKSAPMGEEQPLKEAKMYKIPTTFNDTIGQELMQMQGYLDIWDGLPDNFKATCEQRMTVLEDYIDRVKESTTFRDRELTAGGYAPDLYQSIHKESKAIAYIRAALRLHEFEERLQKCLAKQNESHKEQT